MRLCDLRKTGIGKKLTAAGLQMTRSRNGDIHVSGTVAKDVNVDYALMQSHPWYNSGYSMVVKSNGTPVRSTWPASSARNRQIKYGTSAHTAALYHVADLIEKRLVKAFKKQTAGVL